MSTTKPTIEAALGPLLRGIGQAVEHPGEPQEYIDPKPHTLRRIGVIREAVLELASKLDLKITVDEKGLRLFIGYNVQF